ncbi:PREDICTED: lamin-like protein [Prunus mume]|uniref:Lamin-like protein n=1 Tax=Prunus mume TaxID=102107 RepID=A0ABM0NWF1_PRUMU|nr:PREDICTED: lamin-like protein [Prunus mume]
MKMVMRSNYSCRLAGFRWGAVVITAITVGWLMTSANGVLHKVGGAQGWNQNVNYTEWSANENFYVGEWLLFNFDKRYYNVLEVNKSSFDSCNDQGFMKNITRGGRDVYQLTEDRPYYFLSGGGYCFHGMRLALVALQDQQQLPPAPALAPSTNAASPNSLTSAQMFIFLSATVISLGLPLMWDVDLFKSYV